jgi:ArsR family transcriptional regulator
MQTSAYALTEISADLKVLGDPTRLRILALLQAAGELCVCHVESALRITQSRASRHLTALRRAGFVADRRDGAWVHYRVHPEPGCMQAAVLGALREQLHGDPDLAADAVRARDLSCGDSSR